MKMHNARNERIKRQYFIYLKEANRRSEQTVDAVAKALNRFETDTKHRVDGTHHHVSGEHLPLYLAELDFKYNTRKITDGARTVGGIQRMAGKRLMLRRPKMPKA